MMFPLSKGKLHSTLVTFVHSMVQYPVLHNTTYGGGGGGGEEGEEEKRERKKDYLKSREGKKDYHRACNFQLDN